MLFLLLLSLAAYGWLILRCRQAWKKIPSTDTPAGFRPATAISVIIPVRNEAANMLPLLQDLATQVYPQQLLEVLIIDDHSEDGTAELVEEFILSAGMVIKSIRLNSYVKLYGKKAAVAKGVELAQGELLVFTDGDCRVGPEWLRQFAYLYQTQQPYFISGPVCFHHTYTLFERMQLVEFAALIGVGGASIRLQKPNMCNGANLAYTKAIFEAAGGFSGNESIASGDDEFLLHKVSKLYPGKIAFLKNNKAIVYTCARKSLASFLSQRVRWASKWKAYQSINVQVMAAVVFVVNLLLFAAVVLLWLGRLPLLWFIAAYVAKFAIDFIFLERILTFLGRRRYLWYMLPLQCVYIPYVICTAVAGLAGRYRWKGRIIRTP
ncbi:glycosyltransferase [Pontibacter sp. 172403-2]|nr:glycosyltransferase [Pontibacter sp. 172403-2]